MRISDWSSDVCSSDLNLVSAQRDEIVASYQVLTAIGRMTAADLGLPTAVYNPESDYREVRDSWFGLDAPGDEPASHPMPVQSRGRFPRAAWLTETLRFPATQ